MQAWAGDHQYIGYVPGQGVLINQARIGVELGSTPWTTVPFRAPTSELRHGARPAAWLVESRLQLRRVPGTVTGGLRLLR
jgi:hypothetical protein